MTGHLKLNAYGYIIDKYPDAPHGSMTIEDWNKLGNAGWEVTALFISNGYTRKTLLKRKKLSVSQPKR